MIVAKWLIIGIALITATILIWRMSMPKYAGPTIGEPAPDFELIDQNGQTHTLADYRGHWLVLYFYPKDDTPGCTQQACRFRDDIARLTTLDAKVVGISLDGRPAHERFSKKYSLPFVLLSDIDAITSAKYGSLSNFGVIKFAKRNTFLIDPQGGVAKIYLGADSARSSKQVIDDLSVLRES